MLEPTSVENYLAWCQANPARAAKLDFYAPSGFHSQLLGYVRWCAMKREETPDGR